jgi:hypothetical protein
MEYQSLVDRYLEGKPYEFDVRMGIRNFYEWLLDHHYIDVEKLIKEGDDNGKRSAI